MKAICPAIFILLFTLHYSKGQNQVNYWMGGDNALVKFDNNGAHFLHRPDNNSFWRTSASISDSVGNLLFYTNGFRVFNKNFQVMQNGDNLNIGDFVNSGDNLLPIEDGAVIIPVPGSISQYYLFHDDCNLVTFPNDTNDEFATHIFYSIIDMSLDNGNGAIVNGKKDIPVISDTLTDGMKLVKHGNGRDWWLLCHKYWTNRYYSFSIDPTGIHGPYFQDIGIDYKVYDGDSPSKFSDDGKLFAQLTVDSNIFELYNFDRCTGELFNYNKVKVNDTSLYLRGISFSPSEKYLYISSNFNQILQFNLTAADIYSTRTVVGKDDGIVDPFPAAFYLQQLGPDGKLYIFDYDGYYSINVIDKPDSGNLACNFIQRGLVIDSPSDWFASCPNVPNYALGPLSGSACDTLTGVTQLPNPEFTWSVYPNPFAEQLNISVTDANTDAEISLFNLVGQQVFYTKQKQQNNFVYNPINVSSLPAGIYIVTIKVNGWQCERKVVKE